MRDARGQRADDKEDWTQISDKATRKRVQNRLAQRNYRQGLKARLKELERLATQKDSSATHTDSTPPPPTHDSSSSAKAHARGPKADGSGLASPNAPLSGGGFTMDSSAPDYMYQHSPLPNCPGGSGGLGMNPNMPFTNPFQVPGWAGPGNMLPATNLSAQNFAHAQGFPHPQSMAGGADHMGFQGMAGDMDGLGRYLNQHRLSIDSGDMQTYATSSASTWAPSDGSGQSTYPNTIADQSTPSDSFSAPENETAAGTSSRRRPVSKNSSRMCSENPRPMDECPSPTELNSYRGSSFPFDSANASSEIRQGRRHRHATSASQAAEGFSANGERPAAASGTLSTRIASAMKAISALGFSDIEELVAKFYTANLQDQPTLADTQRISRRRGLTHVLAKLREHAKDDWSDWEAQGYREEIVRAAEDIIGNECGRFSEEDVARSSRRGTNVAELKRRYQDELPNLYSLLNALILSSQRGSDADCSTVIVHAISSILSGSEHPRNV